MKKMDIQMVPIAGLVLDYDLYPRTQVNGIHVRDMCDAIEAGVHMPPVIADKKTKRVVDGFHRVTAYKRNGQKEIKTEWRIYNNDSELFLDAVQLNASHGQKFSHYEIVRIFTKCQTLGVDPEVIAGATHLTITRLNEMVDLKTAIIGKTLTPIKRTLSCWRGRQIGKKQIQGNIRAGGHHALFYINQVINLLDHDLIDLDDRRILNALLKLKGLISEATKKAKAA